MQEHPLSDQHCRLVWFTLFSAFSYLEDRNSFPGCSMKMLIFILPLCSMLSVESMSIHFNLTLRDASHAIPLSMVEDSVDDMYRGCNETMMKIINDKYFIEQYDGPYAEAWTEAEPCAEKKLREREDEALTKNHMQAICVYTSDNVYEDFNNAVRTKGKVYTSSFQFHFLHFFLTSAVQILNNNHCHITYRRTNVVFTGKVHQRIRFGSFTSSSYRTDLHNFGNQSCFKIRTCSGAFLKNYSVYDTDEAEVLIPPYEVFRIKEILDGPMVREIPELNDCRKVFVLENLGDLSELNCKIAHI